MQLHTRTAGQGAPVVLLHGLFGSHENLGVLARDLAADHTVFGMDLRNHGRSPHADAMTLPAMAADVIETMDAHDLDSATLLGHSLGGKIAMEIALTLPARVDGLVIIDIAPVAYERGHDTELNAMLGLDLEALGSRKEADEALASALPNPAIRQFLLKNLVREGDGFQWRLPLQTIADEYDSIATAPSGGRFDGPTLFIRGGASDYITTEYEAAIREHFPQARIETIVGAAHWVHVEAADEVIALSRGLIESAAPAS
jgi:esterase